MSPEFFSYLSMESETGAKTPSNVPRVRFDFPVEDDDAGPPSETMEMWLVFNILPPESDDDVVSSVESVGPLRLRKRDFSAVSRCVRSVHDLRFSEAEIVR